MKPRHNHTFEALGTHWALETLGNNNLSDELVASVTQMVEQFTRDYSRFDPQSLIGTLNTAGSIQHPSEELRAMLAFAQKMFIASDGAFNISIGGALHKLGYGSQQQAARVWVNPWPSISIDNEHIAIPQDMTIDFGGFGKGWLIDKLAVLFTNSGITEFIINGGGDLYIHTSTPTEIGLEHPYDSTKTIGSTRISQGGLGVSSNIKRTWQKDGNTHAHILRPNESLPLQEHVISTYVRADSALIADTMATILLLRPDLEAQLTKTFDLKVILLTEDMLSSMTA
ncbi:MAG: FAD:protein FMN transferase [Candidatus Saccharimonadales bacterium]